MNIATWSLFFGDLAKMEYDEQEGERTTDVSLS